MPTQKEQQIIKRAFQWIISLIEFTFSMIYINIIRLLLTQFQPKLSAKFILSTRNALR